MWIFAKDGFLSITPHKEKAGLLYGTRAGKGRY